MWRAVGPLREHARQNYKSVVVWEQLQMQPASSQRKNFIERDNQFVESMLSRSHAK